MKMIQTVAFAIVVVAGSASKLRSGVAPLATDATVGHLASSAKALAADLTTKNGADMLLHLLVEDEKKAKENTKKKDTKEKKEKAKDQKGVIKAGMDDSEFSAFLPACLAHTKRVIQVVDGSYTDIQLKTTLQNECQFSKEFPLTKDHGFKDHTACMDFAGDLTKARHAELANGSTKGYETFCEKFFVHQGGKRPSASVDTMEQKIVTEFGFYWRAVVLVVALFLFLAGILACVFLRKKSPQQGN